MKKGLVLPVVLIMLASISFPNANIFSEQAEASIVENYFPFHVGNQWTYTDGTKELTFSIIGTQEINGHTYYKFDDYFSAGLGGDGQTMGTEVLLRYDRELDAVLMYFHFRGEDVDITRYNFGGGRWAMAGLECRFKQRGVTCDVPAGQFSDCTNFQFLGYDAGPDCYGYGEYVAPGVGCVKYVVPGGACLGTDQKEGDLVTFQLRSYQILPSCGDADHPYPVGDLNHDCRVDMFDLAILSSNWLECTAPECDLRITDVTIFRCELVGNRFERFEEVHELTVGDVFVVQVEIFNFGHQTKNVLNLCGLVFSPENCVKVVASSWPSVCAANIPVPTGGRALLTPLCSSQAFKAEEAGHVIMHIYVDDWNSRTICDSTFTTEILSAQ